VVNGEGVTDADIDAEAELEEGEELELAA
jgi:hypothetical protein